MAGALVPEDPGVGAEMGTGETVSVLQAASSHSENARISKVDWFFIEF